MSDDFKFFTMLVGIPLAIIAFIAFGLNAWTASICSRYERITGKQTMYANFDSCYVQHEGQWMRWEEYKMVIIGKDGLSAEAPDV
jgi:hypothetical protein